MIRKDANRGMAGEADFRADVSRRRRALDHASLQRPRFHRPAIMKESVRTL